MSVQKKLKQHSLNLSLPIQLKIYTGRGDNTKVRCLIYRVYSYWLICNHSIIDLLI